MVDQDNQRIQTFDANGSFIATFGEFNNPYGVTVDDLGGVFVVDNATRMVKKYASGEF